MIQVVNMIPNTMSGETNQDSEPNLAVNPSNPLQIAGSAFTPDPLGGANAPIFVSTDGGNTWLLNNIVPSTAGSPTGDITLRFGGTSNTLYAGILRRPGSLRLNILRTNNFISSALMTVLVDRTGSGVDQPYVQAATVMGGAGVGNDRVFVGNNDFNNAPATASIEESPNAATASAPAGFTTVRVEKRTPSGQDMPPIRPAIHLDGTIYAVFYRRTSSSGGNGICDVVVVRDDNWGTGTNPFTALTDPSDSVAGRLARTGVTVPFNTGQALGQERLVSSNLSIAVDPRNSSKLYVAWADFPTGSTTYTLHVIRSLDRGATWTSSDLRTVSNATNPALAINSRGKVGFLYQQLTGTGSSQRWVTHLELTTNDWASAATDIVLATTPAATPVRTFGPYLGDYVHLMALGKNFYGIFSANNTPDNANFPNGVVFQRNANFTTHTLLNTDGVTTVPISIDPFFFKATELDAGSDFYVRDWTDSPTSGDTGLEPSTHPVFYATSDVWNRRTDAPGSFNTNDQPVNEDPQQGTGAGANNFAFARIRRNATGGAETVSAHFLVSEFGTGSNYANAGTAPDATISFAAADLVKTMANGYPWHLDPTTSDHLCLAVEISTPSDPIVSPSLLGRAPGWPTTDLMVINDNNKAQRNMGVGPVTAAGSICFYCIVHNAATFRRDVQLRYEVQPQVQKRIRRARLDVVGGERQPFKPGTFTIPNMQPGENRWVGLSFDVPQGKEGELLPVFFYEMVDGRAVNGFGIAAQVAPVEEVIRYNLKLHGANFLRVARAFRTEGAEELFKEANDLLRDKVTPQQYIELLKARTDAMSNILQSLLKLGGAGDPFGIRAALKNLTAGIGAGVEQAATAHGCLVQKLDAFITMVQKAGGDVADIVQNVSWQADLFERVEQLRKLNAAEGIVKASREFTDGYGNRKVGNEDYPRLVREQLDPLRQVAQDLGNAVQLDADLAEMERNLGSPQALQKAHRGLLLKLNGLPG